MTCSLTRPARCRRCWLYWLALGCVLEIRGWRAGCHPTLSRDARYVLCRLLGPRGPWAAALAGAWFSWHLHRLQDVLDPAPEES